MDIGRVWAEVRDVVNKVDSVEEKVDRLRAWVLTWLLLILLMQCVALGVIAWKVW